MIDADPGAGMRSADPPRPIEPSSADELAASIVRHRTWLIALTVVVVLMILTACAPVALLFGIGGLVDGTEAPSDAQLQSVRQRIEDALGGRLADADVRAVTVVYDDAPFPFPLLTGGEQVIYLEASLADSDVVIADVIASSQELASSGLLPTAGRLTERMTGEQFDRLVAAFAVQTDAPLGPVFRYIERLAMEVDPIPEEVRVEDREYRVAELWSATVGRRVEGDRLDLGADASDVREALIFHEDPETGQFTYLTTEPVEDMFTPGLLID
ncbi:MAG: hypothetical protein IBX62_01220 [Coriobacteriia bacterium]|nr:hypothetical protein [Coriobacteriia bacterium]